MTGALIPGVERIAVLRANAIGDLLVALPALEALRAAYPSAEVTLIGRAHHAELLCGRPSPVDAVEVAPPYGGVTAPEGAPQAGPELDGFFARMRARRFDLALQLHGGGANSTPFLHGLGARTTAGLRARGAPALDRWVRYSLPQHEVLRYVEAVGLVGAGTPPSLVPRLAVTAADRAAADRAAADRAAAGRAAADRAEADAADSTAAAGHTAERRATAVLHPGATDARRRWPADRFAAVGRALHDRGLDVLVSGDTRDAPLAEATAERCAGRSIAGTVGLSGLLGVLERAAIVVSNDSGPLHLAAAVGTPAVGVYWWPNVLTFGPPATDRCRPVVSWRSRCPRPGCGADHNPLRRACGHGDSFVADVDTTEVLGEVDDLLAHR